jgi:DNA-binding NtrC family response regulator
MLYGQHQAEIKAVVIDVMMPFMEGPATIRAMQRLDSEVKVIISSGLDTDVKAAEAVATGWQAFLPKPYTAGQLLRTLAEILNQQDGQGVAANSRQDQPGRWPGDSLRT